MRTSDLAESYARALFDLASAADAVDAVDEGIVAIVSAVRGHTGLRETLMDMMIPGTKKRDVMRDIFSTDVAPEAVAVASAMVERGHAGMLDDVAEHYRRIAEAERGIVVAEVVTAVPLDERTRAAVTDKLTSSLGRPVTLRESVDPAVLGGIVIRVAGRVLDGSLSSQLDAMRAVLSTTPQGGEA